MSLLGKILAFLNILGALGFISLAAMDYGKRQAWAYAVFRHDLLNNGLPRDDQEQTKYGERIVDTIGEQTVKELFPGTTGFATGEAPTQIGEVKRVEALVRGNIEADQDKSKQMLVYARYLRPLATSNAEREQLHAILYFLSDPKRTEKLKTDLQQAIRPALDIMTKDSSKAQEKDKRTFPEAYLEAVRDRRGQPSDPFIQAMLKVLPKGEAKYDAAYKAAVQAAGADARQPLEELFLRQLRNEPNGTFKALFDAAFDEALESMRADLKQQLDDHFAEARDGKRKVKDSQGQVSQKVLSADQQKRAIAHLLFNLIEAMPNPSAQEGQAPVLPAAITADQAYKRYLTVVGLREAGKEIDRQAKELQDISTELSLAMAREQTTFVRSHEDLLRHIKDRAGHVEVQNALAQRAKDMADEKVKVVERRNTDKAEYVAKLKDEQAITSARIAELRKMSEALYNIRVETRDLTTENREKEQQLGRLEDRVR